jgi:hypothetical protein
LEAFGIGLRAGLLLISKPFFMSSVLMNLRTPGGQSSGFDHCAQDGPLGYQQSLYHVVVIDDKDPPTVQRIKDTKGNITEGRVQMTGRELAASGACFSPQ